MNELHELQKSIIAELRSAVTANTWQCEGVDCLTRALATVNDILEHSTVAPPGIASQVSGNK